MMKSIKFTGLVVLGSIASTTLSLAVYAGNPASVEYVDQQDNLLNEQIAALLPASPYTVGQLLKNNSNQTWGIVIYVDPQASDYLAVAFSSGGALTTEYPWANPALSGSQVSAGKYGIYGGVDATGGNTAAYCNSAGDCGAVSPTSAFGACRTYNGGGYTDWYLPSIAELTLFLDFYQQYQYGTDDVSNSVLPSDVNYTFWSSTEHNGYGFTPGNSPSPSTQALSINIATGAEGAALKTVSNSVLCMRALPA